MPIQHTGFPLVKVENTAVYICTTDLLPPWSNNLFRKSEENYERKLETSAATKQN